MKTVQHTIPMVIGAAVLAGTLGFFGGMHYQQKKAVVRGQFFQRAGDMRGGAFEGGVRGGNRGGGMMNGGSRPVSGDILSVDATGITVKMADGSSRIIILTDKTTINKADAGTKNDLVIGEKVMVFGAENSDGSLTATAIQLNPSFAGRGDVMASPRP